MLIVGYYFSSSKENGFNIINLSDPLEESGFLFFMKTKNLAIVFIIFLAITLSSGLAVFLTEEKNQPFLSRQFAPMAESVEPAIGEPLQLAASSTKDKKIVEAVKNSPFNVKSKETVKPETAEQLAPEEIKAVMIIGSDKYETAVKLGSSVYDLMNLLKAENKIDFSGKNYAGLGFFVEALNGLKNNPVGENWVYYINGQPAPVGISNYELKNNDVIEWRYEEKFF